jgi:biotin carboxyl carrier protein
MKYITTINDKKFEIEITNDGNVLVNGEKRDVDFLALGPSLYSVIMQTKSHEVVIDERNSEVDVLMGGRLFTGKVMDERAQLMSMRRGGQVADSGEISIKSPMPGLIVAIPVSEGKEVKAGETVIILESMKMQNELKAPRDGVVSRVSVQEQQSVEQGKVLVTIV